MKWYFMSGQEPEGGGVYKSKDRREYACGLAYAFRTIPSSITR
jgi:hypothetical protein